MEPLPICLGRSKTANGGDEWYLVVGGQRLGNYFTDSGKRPAEALPIVLKRATEGRAL